MFRLDELDPPQPSAPATTRVRVIADPHATYFGAELGDRTLLPGDGAQFGATRFEDWLEQSLVNA